MLPREAGTQQNAKENCPGLHRADRWRTNTWTLFLHMFNIVVQASVMERLDKFTPIHWVNFKGFDCTYSLNRHPTFEHLRPGKYRVRRDIRVSKTALPLHVLPKHRAVTMHPSQINDVIG